MSRTLCLSWLTILIHFTSQAIGADLIFSQIAVAVDGIGRPKYNLLKEVGGVQVLFVTDPPPESNRFDIAIYIERKASENWVKVDCTDKEMIKKYYYSDITWGVKDFTTSLLPKQQMVNFFIPHSALQIPFTHPEAPDFPKQEVELRLVIRYFDRRSDGTLIALPQHERTTSSFFAFSSPPDNEGVTLLSRVFRGYAGKNGPPFQLVGAPSPK